MLEVNWLRQITLTALLTVYLAGLNACGSVRVGERDFTTFRGKVNAGANTPLEGAGVIIWAQAPGENPIIWDGVSGAGGAFSVDVEWLAFADYYVKITHPRRKSGPLAGADTDYDKLVAAGDFKRGDSEYQLDPLDIGAL